jgi:hypothetical protein
MADYTYEQYMEAAKNADNAGDEDAARKLVQAAISLKKKTVDKKDQEVGVVEDVLRSVGGGLGRGISGAVELPELAGRGVIRGFQELGQLTGLYEGEDLPVFDTSTGKALRGAAEAVGLDDELDYRGQTTAGKYAGTISEFAGGGGALGLGGKVLKNIAKSPTARKLAAGAETAGLGKKALAGSVLAGGGSELAGQLSEGTQYEPYARLGGALVSPMAANTLKNTALKAISPYGGADPSRAALAKFLGEKGVSTTAGQKVGSDTLRRKESMTEAGGQLRGTQADEFTKAVLKEVGSDAPRATPDALIEIQSRLGQNMNESISGIKLIPEPEDLKNMSKVLQKYKKLKPVDPDAEVTNTLLKQINRSLIDTVSKKSVIDEEQFISFRRQLSKQTMSKDEATKNATIETLKILDDLMDKQLTASGRSSDIQKLNKARSDYRNYFAIENSVSGSGELKAMGIITPSSIGSALRSQNKRQYVQGKRGDLGELSRAGEAVAVFPRSSGTAENIQSAIVGKLSRQIASGTVGAGLGTLVGIPPIVTGVIAAFAPGAVNKLLGTKAGQAYLANQLVKKGEGLVTEDYARTLVGALASEASKEQE